MASSRSRWITPAAGRTSTSSRSPTTWPSSSTNRPSSPSRPVTTRARVGLLHYTSPPIIGGVETILHEQAVRLPARGHPAETLHRIGRVARGRREAPGAPPAPHAESARPDARHVATPHVDLSREKKTQK